MLRAGYYMDVSFFMFGQNALRLVHSFLVNDPIKFSILRRKETVPTFYEILRTDGEDVFFFHK